MSSSLSSLIDNLADINCEKCDNKREYIGFRDIHLLLKCFDCNAWFKRDSKELIKRVANTYEFCNKDINKFILLLRKDVYPYEHMDNWEKFNEVVLPDKKVFYSNLNIKHITNVDYRHGNSVFKEFEMNNLGDYHDLYVKSDTVLLVDVFENFRKMCMKIYELDPSHFLTAPGLVSQACLNKTEVELELITDLDILLMIEEGIRGGMCHAVHGYAKANNKYMKNYDKKEESLYIQYLDAKNLYGWAMSQKLPVGGFKWIEDVSKMTKIS